MNANNGAKIIVNPTTTIFALLAELPAPTGVFEDGVVDGVVVDDGDLLLSPLGVVVEGELELWDTTLIASFIPELQWPNDGQAKYIGPGCDSLTVVVPPV